MTDLGEAVAAGFDLDHKYTAENATVLLTGVQALVRVVFDQMRADRRRGLRTATFASGYPGSPFGGLDKELSSPKALLKRWNVVHRPGHNEDLAATAVAGSQVAPSLASSRFEGVLGIWYGKAPGLDRSIDAIRHGLYVGTSRLGGTLAYVGDDPASKSSSIPSGSEHTIRGIGMPLLEPGTIQEVVEFGLHGVAMSRLTGLWSAVRVTAPVADSIGTARVFPEQADVVVPSTEWRGKPYAPHLTPNVTGNFAIDTEVELLGVRYRLARDYGAANELNRVVVSSSDDWLGIASHGQTYHELRTALGLLGLDDEKLRALGIRLLHVQMPDPIDPAVLRRFGRGLSEIAVVEEKRSFLEGTIREALYGTANPPRIVGKEDGDGNELFPVFGTLDADRIAAVLVPRLTQRIDPSRLQAPKPPRKLLPVASANRAAYLCSGCPHNTSLRVPEGVLLGAGIGCHALGGRMDPAMFGVTAFKTHMGGEGAGWIGMAPFVDDRHLIQNIGDGTFFHSGQLAVQASIAARSNITYKLLWNGAIAMTGGQSTANSNAVPITDLVEVLLRQGVERIIITTDDIGRYRRIRLPKGVEAWDRTRVIEAQEVLAKVAGVTVMIHDQQSATEKRRARKRGLVAESARRIVINERVCEGCGDCGVKSNCLSVEPVETEFGRKTRVNQSTCNSDESCLRGECPSFLSVVPSAKRVARSGGVVEHVDAATIPTPMLVVPSDDMVVRMPGIGGTGVVTVNQMLGTAAMLDGRFVVGLDQTGLSQKAGPVVSDLRISSSPPDGSNRPVAGSVDLYLVFDLLVGVAPSNLDGVSPERTVAVVSTSRTPTGDMVSHVDASYPDEDRLELAIGANVRMGQLTKLDALGATRALLGDTATANVLLLGAAFQAGALPISAGSIERAIELNGVAVERNVQAFRWGRIAIADRGRFDAAVATRSAAKRPERRDPLASPEVASLVARVEADPSSGLAGLLAVRVADLIAYQDVRYARRYVALVAEVRRAEAGINSGVQLTEAVARHFHRLLAYKDEYEVARLHLDPLERERLAEQFGADAKVSWNLQPPVLTKLLGDRKLVLGPWFAPAFAALRAARRVRSTPFDPFGRTTMRRMERELAAEYESTLRTAVAKLDADSLSATLELALLPDMIRGYESVKLANVTRYRAALATAKNVLGL